uniref:Uncharacterized protein n=1 Tax=Rhizophora mucronata TaxID=61149 RepID=A0A2P2J2C3_RHIMU
MSNQEIIRRPLLKTLTRKSLYEKRTKGTIFAGSFINHKQHPNLSTNSKPTI